MFSPNSQQTTSPTVPKTNPNDGKTTSSYPPTPSVFTPNTTSVSHR